MSNQHPDSDSDSGSDSGNITLRVANGVDEFSEAEWSGLEQTSRDCASGYNPFISHAFLKSLEASGCATPEVGWLAQFLRLERSDGSLLGAVPCYLKSHSQGEYVFDHGWAEAFERAGGHYYPKLQVSVPFTPATGPRLLIARQPGHDGIRPALANGLKTLGGKLGSSSVHVTFATRIDVDVLQQSGFLHRIDQQFHFNNQDYASYDEFLATLSSRKRKVLKKERRIAVENDIEIEWLTGSDITEAVWDEFFAFYVDTGSRKWGRPYLNRTFFSLIGEAMAEDVLLVMARRQGRYIAGALNFIGSDTIFGRHWGCSEQHPFLHFELCYHQAIDFAIAKGLKVVEAGAQGEHKLARGYVPVTTHSAHYIPHEGFRRAVADYLSDERADVARMGEILDAHTPFRKG